MKVQQVHQNAVAQVWPRVERFIQDVEPHAGGEWVTSQIKADVIAGRLLLAVFADGEEIVGAVVFTYQNNRNARTAFIMALAGSGLTTPENWEQLKAIFKSGGATEVAAAMRPATLRLWSRLGFTPKYEIAGVTL